jgi:hypothetical protein
VSRTRSSACQQIWRCLLFHQRTNELVTDLLYFSSKIHTMLAVHVEFVDKYHAHCLFGIASKQAGSQVTVFGQLLRGDE